MRGLRGVGLDRRGDDGLVVGGRVFATAILQILDQLRSGHTGDPHVPFPSSHPDRILDDLRFRVSRMRFGLGLDAHLCRRDRKADRSGDIDGVEISDLENLPAFVFHSAETILHGILLFDCEWSESATVRFSVGMLKPYCRRRIHSSNSTTYLDFGQIGLILL